MTPELTCTACNGKGRFESKTGADSFQCNYCNGLGKIKQDTPTEHLAEFADKFGFGEEE